jgi:hypothetical protein
VLPLIIISLLDLPGHFGRDFFAQSRLIPFPPKPWPLAA